MQKQLQDCNNCSLVMRAIKFTCDIKFGGHGLFSFRDFAHFKNDQIPFWTIEYI